MHSECCVCNLSECGESESDHSQQRHKRKKKPNLESHLHFLRGCVGVDGERRPLLTPFPLSCNESSLVAMLASGLAGNVNPFVVMGCLSMVGEEEEGEEWREGAIVCGQERKEIEKERRVHSHHLIKSSPVPKTIFCRSEVSVSFRSFLVFLSFPSNPSFLSFVRLTMMVQIAFALDQHQPSKRIVLCWTQQNISPIPDLNEIIRATSHLSELLASRFSSFRPCPFLCSTHSVLRNPNQTNHAKRGQTHGLRVYDQRLSHFSTSTQQ